MDSTEVTEGFVTSADGTSIGYLRRGTGPGLVLVQGAMGTAHDFDELAAALSDAFTVYAVDRRGRGMSPKPYDASHSITRDVEDIDAVLAATGASFVFGLSSGAVITLEAARTLPRVTRAAVYEPPFYADGISHEGIRELDAEVERGDLAAALVTALRTSGTAPAPLRVLPKRIARMLSAVVLWADARNPRMTVTLRDLVPGIRYDFNVVGGVDRQLGRFETVGVPMLLLTGSKSPAFLRHAIRELDRLLPDARLVEFEGLGHDGSWIAARGGRPAVVAAELRAFFRTP